MKIENVILKTRINHIELLTPGVITGTILCSRGLVYTAGKKCNYLLM
jgi:hypothetical protein